MLGADTEQAFGSLTRYGVFLPNPHSARTNLGGSDPDAGGEGNPHPALPRRTRSKSHRQGRVTVGTANAAIQMTRIAALKTNGLGRV